MGCIISRKTSDPTPPFAAVRVINISGHVVDFDAPVTVAEITGKPPKHILCSSAHLVAFGSNPLRPDDNLEPGRLYFLLPHSVFDSESSATDLAALMARLRSVAKKSGQPPAGDCRRPARECGEKGGNCRTWKPRLEPIYERSFGRSLERPEIAVSGGLSSGEGRRET